jgi:protein-tyrosine phosphatase
VAKKVLFVCLGNICRSPAAEGIFRHMVAEQGLSQDILIDSAGTGAWHEGDAPDGRMIHHAKQRGYDLSDLIGRQFVAPQDLEKFDYILTMDDDNLKNVRAMDRKSEHGHKIKPLATFCRVHDAKEIPDPYHRDELGFEHVLDLLEDACAELLRHLRQGETK